MYKKRKARYHSKMVSGFLRKRYQVSEMSTFLIIKPDFEKNHESEKGLDTIRQHATGSASSFGGETGFMILWILELVSYLSVLSWGISFQLVEKPAEIKLIIIPDDFRNFIDGIGCCFK